MALFSEEKLSSFEKILEVKSNVQIKGLCFLYLL